MRCGRGWKLFWRIGEARDKFDQRRARRDLEIHQEVCEECRSGIREMLDWLQEQADMYLVESLTNSCEFGSGNGPNSDTAPAPLEMVKPGEKLPGTFENARLAGAMQAYF